MFLREVVTGKREGKPIRYGQIVESYRNADGKSRHRVLMPLGRVDQIDKEKIRKLIVSLSRYLDTGTMPEGGRLGEVRDFGLGYVAAELWRRFDLTRFFGRELKRRKFEAPVERAIFAMTVHRLVDPSSKLSCWDWLHNDAHLDGCRELKLQHLYRAMDFLDDCHESLEAALYDHRKTLFDKVELVYYDTTSTYFENDEPGDEPEQYGLRQRGYSRDLRPDRKQIVIGLAVDQQGLPIISDVYSGDTSDSLTVVPMLSRLKKLGLRRVVWVADRGMASKENVASVVANDLDYVLGVRLRAAEELREAISADKTEYIQAADGLQVKDVRICDKRYVVCFAPASAERDLKLRTGAIARMRDVLERVNGGGDSTAITEHGLYRRLVSKHSDGQFHLDKKKLEREAQCDGTFVLEVSNAKMGAAQAALAYKGLLRVEQAFRTLKHGVDIRPVYHRLDKRIRAHVSLCMLGYLLERSVELSTKVPFEQTRKAFSRLRAAQLHFEGQTVWETSTASAEAKTAFKSLRMDPPPRVLAVP